MIDEEQFCGKSIWLLDEYGFLARGMVLMTEMEKELNLITIEIIYCPYDREKDEKRRTLIDEEGKWCAEQWCELSLFYRFVSCAMKTKQMICKWHGDWMEF